MKSDSESEADPEIDSNPNAAAKYAAGLIKSRWPQFGLRTFFVLITIAGIAAGMWGTRLYQQHAAKLAVKTLEGAGAVALKRKKTDTIYRVHFKGKNFDDKAVAELAPHLYYLPNLEQLDLVKVPVTDDGLKHLSRLRRLKNLYVFETQVTDAGIADLQTSLPRLTIKKEMPEPWATSMAGKPIYQHAINAVAVRLGGGQLVAGNGAGELLWWDGLNKPANPIRTAAHTDWLFGLAYSHDDMRLATGGGDGLIKIWDTKTKTQLAEIDSHSDDVHAVAFSPDGQSIYSVSDDMTVRRTWIQPTAANSSDDSPQHRSVVLGRHAATIPAMALHPDGTILASASRDETIALWDTEKGGLIRALEGHTDDVMSIAFSTDGTTLVSASYDGKAGIWDVQTGKSLGFLDGHKGRAYAVAISPDGETIASGGEDGLIVWERDSLTAARRLRRQKNISCLRFLSDTELVASDISGRVRSVDLTTGKTNFSFSTSRAALPIN